MPSGAAAVRSARSLDSVPRRQEPRGQGGRPTAQRTRAALRPCGKARGVGLSCNGQGKVLLSALRSEGRRARTRSNVTEHLRTLACAADPTSQRMRVEDAFPAAQGRASSSSVANAPVSFATSKRFARGFRRACFVFDAGFSDQKAVF